MDLPTSVANKRLTAWLSPLDATLTENWGWGYSSHFGTLKAAPGINRAQPDRAASPSAQPKPARISVLSSRCCLRFGEESEPGMTARILDGTKIRDQIFAELKDEVRLLTAAAARPGLSPALGGANAPSPTRLESQIPALP